MLRVVALAACVLLTTGHPHHGRPAHHRRRDVQDMMMNEQAQHEPQGMENEGYRPGDGISVRLTWLGLTCAIGGSPCDFVQKYEYRTYPDGEWREFKNRIPVGLYRYGNDCEFIIRDVPPDAHEFRIQLINAQNEVLADTGALRPDWQTVVHPLAHQCR